MFVLTSLKFNSVMRKTVVRMTKMKTIVSDNNIKNHSSDECGGEESFEEDESSGDDRSLENNTLGSHMTSQSDISKNHCLHGQG